MISTNSADRMQPHITSLLALIGIFVVLYSTEISTFTFSQDDELAAFRTVSDVWLAQGRWAVWLIETLFFPRPIIPYLPIMLFGLLGSIGYLFAIRAYDMRPGASSFVLFPIFIAFPTWFSLLEFGANVIATGTGVCALGAAALLFRYSLTTPRAIRWAGFILLGAFAIACYQTLILGQAVVSLGILMMLTIRDGWSAARLVRETLILVALLIGALLTYWLILQVLLTVTGVQIEYLQSFFNLPMFLDRPVVMVADTVLTAASIYLGGMWAYGLTAPALAVLFGLAFSIVIWAVVTKTRGLTATLLILAALAVIAVPFIQFPFAGFNMPLRALTGVPFAVWTLAAIAMIFASNRISLVIAGVMVAVAVSCINIIAQQSATASFTRTHDQLLAQYLMEEIDRAIPNYDSNVTYKVDFFGGVQFKPHYYPGAGSTVSNSFFGLAGGQTARILAYMSMVGFTNLIEVTPEERQAHLSTLLSMPIWPALGSVRNENGIVLVRLNKDPGFDHMNLVPRL